jgi:streptogramin lyase
MGMHSSSALRRASSTRSSAASARRRIPRIRAVLALCGVGILVGTASVASSSPARGATFSPIAKGDIVASLANGQVNEYSPSGSFVQTLISNASTPTGSAFDGAGNLYVTEFGGNDILKVDASTGAVSVFSNDSILGDGTSFDAPESIAFGPGYKQMYVSDANRDEANGGIHVIDTATGKGAGFFKLPSSSGSEGVGESDWLAFDHTGTLFMTNENPAQGIMQVDQSSGDVVQPSFVANLPNYGYALSFDANGNIWLSDTSTILEYDPSGNLINTITNPNFQTVFSAVFNPPYNTVYAGDLSSGNIFTYDLQGNLLNTFNVGSGVDGLSVAGTIVAPPPPNKYVALGDSFSAGEGDGDYGWNSDLLVPNNVCHRSSHAYGPLLAADPKLGLGAVNFYACSGAVTADIEGPNHENNLGSDGNPEQAQLGDLSADTTVVTLTIGGNDLGFPYVLGKCVYDQYGKYGHPGCSHDKSLVNDTNARLAAFSGGPPANTPPSDGNPNGLPITPLSTVLADIHARAPHAHVFVADYPVLFGSNFTNNKCRVGTIQVHDVKKFKVITINGDGMFVSSDDASWMNDEGFRLASAIHRQVTAAGSWATFVDAIHNFDGHGLCDSSDSWINQLAGDYYGRTGYEWIWSGSFHPTITGQDQGFYRAFAAAMG